MNARWTVIICSWCVAVGVTLAQSPAPAPKLRILLPTADSYLVGASNLSAEIVPDSTVVTDVTFFVDGAAVCKFNMPPYRCAWDAGQSTAARDVRVVATLPGAPRLVQRLRTQGFAVASSVSVEAVLVSVHVTDDRGRFVEGLRQDQFRLEEDGVQQKITSFLSEDAAASLLLELDISGSMGPAVAELRTATARFLGSLRPVDRVTLAGFNNGLWVLAPASATPAARLAALENLHPAGGTALYDSMIRGLDLLRPMANPRALVVFTDGDDVASMATLDSVRSALASTDVVLYLIAQGRAEKDLTLRAALNKVAVETGGAAYFSSQMSSLQGHFAEIVNDLSHQYVLGYTPARDLGDGAWRKIAVQIVDKDRKLTVRSRQGYLATRRSGRGH